MVSRHGSQALALGLRSGTRSPAFIGEKSVDVSLAGFEDSAVGPFSADAVSGGESVDTSMAGFDGGCRSQVTAGGLAAHAGGLLDSPQRPAQPT
jgi:hypothetical protein